MLFRKKKLFELVRYPFYLLNIDDNMVSQFCQAYCNSHRTPAVHELLFYFEYKLFFDMIFVNSNVFPQIVYEPCNNRRAPPPHQTGTQESFHLQRSIQRWSQRQTLDFHMISIVFKFMAVTTNCFLLCRYGLRKRSILHSYWLPPPFTFGRRNVCYFMWHLQVWKALFFVDTLCALTSNIYYN